VSDSSQVVPSNWVVAPVKEVFGVVGGGTPPTDVAEYWQGTTPWISSADIDVLHQITPRRSISEQGIKNSATNRVPAGSVIVVTRVGLGKVGIAETPMCFSQDSQALIFNRDLLLPKYVLLYMSTAVQIFKHISRGTTISGVTKKQLCDLAFRLPPKPEQVRIVEEIEKQFTRLDAAVVALKRVQANFKRYRAAVLKAACEGRLVTTEAELARRECRYYEPASDLLERILAARRSRWDGAPAKYLSPDPPHSGASFKLSEGWHPVTVEQISFLVQYGSSAKTSEIPEGISVLRMGNLTIDGKLELTKLKYLPEDHDEFPDLLLENGDLLFNRTNSAELVGKSAVYQGNPTPCSFASYLIRVKTIPGCDSRYLAMCLNSGLGREWITSVVSQQVGQANVNGTKLQAFIFPLPPQAEQDRILAEVDRKLSVVEEQEFVIGQNLLRAERLRQSILKRAFEGKLASQDPNDEPATVLLGQLRAERKAAPTSASSSPRRRRKKEAAHVA
jgi:type I restriction enzyme, S subunit